MAPEDDHGPVRCCRRHYGAPPALQRRPWRRRTVLACSNSSSNGVRHALDVDPGVPLLHVLRNELRLTSPKVGCGLEQCSPVPSSPATRCNALRRGRQGLRGPPACRRIARRPDRDTWIRLNGDRTVALFTGKVELGQSQVSAFARIGAEELDVGLARNQRADRRHLSRAGRADPPSAWRGRQRSPCRRRHGGGAGGPAGDVLGSSSARGRFDCEATNAVVPRALSE
jgi:hypothetical protein